MNRRKEIEDYFVKRGEQTRANIKDLELNIATRTFTEHLVRTGYVRSFSWKGIPILQYPSDLIVMQELIYAIRPRHIIETGTAYGGMTIFYADMIDRVGGASVISIDHNIPPSTEELINGQHTGFLVDLIKGDSTDKKTISKIEKCIDGGPVIVSLDSDHTCNHVFDELNLYSSFVTPGSYIIVFDTAIEIYGHLDPPAPHRKWAPGNSPMTAVMKFLPSHSEFEIDKEIEQRTLITSAPCGWLKRIK